MEWNRKRGRERMHPLRSFSYSVCSKPPHNFSLLLVRLLSRVAKRRYAVFLATVCQEGVWAGTSSHGAVLDPIRRVCDVQILESSKSNTMLLIRLLRLAVNPLSCTMDLSKALPRTRWRKRGRPSQNLAVVCLSTVSPRHELENARLKFA